MKKQKKILVVEDEKNLREAIRDVLRAENFSTLEAKNGKEGIKIALKERPDLILLDLLMPEMDGMTAFEKIRKDTWGAKVPVIILTNLNPTAEKLVQDVILNEPLFYLIKSDWKLHDIVDKIEETLKIKG
ncbi:response regulator [Candidatus Gracilibacteria bacterium]|nr:response regulator [Candidatus Gracilibacteria bacterium]